MRENDTNAELAEKIARALCKYHGGDPDEMVLAGDPLGNPAEYPAWMLGLPEARAVAAALRPTASQPAPEVVGALFEAVGAIADMVDGATANHPARLVLSRGRAALAALSAPLAQDVAAGEREE